MKLIVVVDGCVIVPNKLLTVKLPETLIVPAIKDLLLATPELDKMMFA